jgi:gas vesicle structural protein
MAIQYDRQAGRMPARQGPVQRTPGSSSLAEVLDVILDKGIVIDAWVRVNVVGIEILTIEARVVVASVDTYLRYAEAIGLTALAAPPPAQQGRSGQQRGEESPKELPAPDEVVGYLSDHEEGVRLGDMEAYFDVPRRELGEVVNQLVEEGRVRQDEERRTYFAAEGEE